MKTIELCEKFVNGKSEGKCSSVFIKGNVIYSYGYHFPMAFRINDSNGFKFVVNKSKYSRSTSRQQSWLKCNINDSEVLCEMDTNELKRFIDENNGKEVKELILNKLV